jgi:hypothetical protein
MDDNTDVSDMKLFAIFLRGIRMEFNITKELAALMRMRRSVIGADLYEEVRKVL